MIYYDQTVGANRGKVDEARKMIKDMLGFTNIDLDTERSPTNPAYVKFPPDLLFQLVKLLEGPPIFDRQSLRVPYAELTYGGDPNWGKANASQPGPWACTQGTSVWLFDRWADDKVTPERRAAVLAHELVHAICGNELDSEVTENVMFFQKGATIDPSDVYSVMKKRWRGRWFRVVRRDPNIRDIDIQYGWKSSIDPQIVFDLGKRLAAQMGPDLDNLLDSVPVE